MASQTRHERLKKPAVVLHLDRRIPGGLASDLVTRGAQASKTENENGEEENGSISVGYRAA
jgi:hypothetical protein